MSRLEYPRPDLALGREATASTFITNNGPNRVTDGGPESRWESAAEDPAWVEVDLGAPRNVEDVVVDWHSDYSKVYWFLAAVGDPEIVLGINHVTNPRAALNLTGITNAGGLLSPFERVDLGTPGQPEIPPGEPTLTTAVHAGGDADNEHLRWDVATETGQFYSASVWVYLRAATGGAGIRLVVANAAGATKASSSALLTTVGAWVRLDVAFEGDANEDWTLRVRQVGAGTTDFYASGAMYESRWELPTAPGLNPYRDGDFDDAEWVGAPHASKSIAVRDYGGYRRLARRELVIQTRDLISIEGGVSARYLRVLGFSRAGTAHSIFAFEAYPFLGDLVPGQEIVASRRAFPKAQYLFEGVADRRLGELVDVGWHGTDVHDEAGACAVVRTGGAYDDGELVGEVIRVRYGDRDVLAYVVGTAAVPAEISLTRRAFRELGPLYKESLLATVEVVR